MYIFFDTETTGLPKNYNAPAEDLNNWPRIIQLAWSLYDDQKKEVKRVCKLIKPDGWIVPNDKFWLDNGFSQEKSMEEGVPIKEILEEYVKDRLNSKYAIAHNISFDSKVIRSEMIRSSIKADFTAQKVCTMQKSTSYCKIPHKNGRKGVKFPNLTELHEKLFNTGFSKAHDAMADVDACSKCFFELLKRNVITLV